MEGRCPDGLESDPPSILFILYRIIKEKISDTTFSFLLNRDKRKEFSSEEILSVGCLLSDKRKSPQDIINAKYLKSTVWRT